MSGLRRGWCPGLTRPMRTGDGLLVRLHPGNGVLTATQLRAVAAGAREAGNGLVDVTARGNLQLRGVQPGSHPRLAARLAAVRLGDARPPGGTRPEGPQRLTLAAPLAGLDPTARLDAFGLAAAIEAVALDLPGLHPKLLVAVEDGGRAWLGAVDADLRLVPDAAGGLVLTLAGGAVPVPVPPSDAVRFVRAVLLRLAAHGPCRVRDLEPVAREALVRDPAAAMRPSALEIGPPQCTPSRSHPRPDATPRDGGVGGKSVVASARPTLDDDPGAALAPGLHDLGPGGVALAVELPFGRGDAALLDAVADWAECRGDGTARLTPTRGLVLPCLAEPEAVREAARRRGLIVAPYDRRRAVAACPGAPACASGHAPAQADAARLAAALPPGLGLHVSGCAKGCAHPGPAALTLVALPGGEYGVVPGGRAGDAPVTRLSLDAVLARLAAYRGGDPAKIFAVPAETA